MSAPSSDGPIAAGATSEPVDADRATVRWTMPLRRWSVPMFAIAALLGTVPFLVGEPLAGLALLPLAAGFAWTAAAEAWFAVRIGVDARDVTLHTRRFPRREASRKLPRSTVRAVWVTARRPDSRTAWTIELDTTGGREPLRNAVGSATEAIARVRELTSILPVEVVGTIDGLPLADGWWKRDERRA
jgi:hypothetical protein